MAGQELSYQPNEFKVAVGADATVGAPGTTTGILHTDSITFPSMNPIQDTAAKSGSFVAEHDKIFSTSKGSVSEISVSGLLDDNAMSLIPNALATAASSSACTVTDAYTPPAISHGMSAAAEKGMTVKLVSPQLFDDDGSSNAADNTIVLSGCSVTAFSVSGDASGDGRLTYSATLKTGYTPLFGQATGTVNAAAVTGFRHITDFIDIVIAGIQQPVLQSFTLNIENPAEYIGWDPTNNRPYSISRSVPEGPVATLSSVIKLDQDTKGLPASFMATSASTALENTIANHATFGSADEFGFTCDKALITGMSMNEQAAMMYTVEQKLLFGTLVVRNS